MIDPNEKEWWLDKIRAIKLTYGDVDYADIREIVAEAERRTWEAARKNIESSHLSVCADGQAGKDMKAAVDLFKKCLLRSIDNRLKSKL